MTSGENDPVRVAIVGLDSAFWPHGFWSAADEHPDCEVVGVCDLGLPDGTIVNDFVADVSEYLRERALRRFRSLDELLTEGIDAAFLCSRNSVMPTVAEHLIAAGVHVFAAKPLALTSTEARRYLAAREAGLVVTAGQTARAWQPYPTLLRLIDEGRIGRLLTMHVMHQHGHYDDFPPEVWYSDPGEGDACNWLGWYPIEAIVRTMGPVARVHGVARQTASDHDALPDQLAAIVEMVDERFATAVVRFTIGEWPLPMHEAELIGTEGVARYHGPGETVQVLDATGESKVPFDVGESQLVLEVDRFIAAVRGEGEPVLDVETAVHVAETCAAWRESAASGRPVDVPVIPERTTSKLEETV
ncbi:MAG: Gfo/Idh/MocA family oxidoreductase [Actinobacteria bacterium]|nr:Gfo/Idh/MocA family oxidoreductase [Actinomycetota bacterium]